MCQRDKFPVPALCEFSFPCLVDTPKLATFCDVGDLKRLACRVSLTLQKTTSVTCTLPTPRPQTLSWDRNISFFQSVSCPETNGMLAELQTFVRLSSFIP